MGNRSLDSAAISTLWTAHEARDPRPCSLAQNHLDLPQGRNRSVASRLRGRPRRAGLVRCGRTPAGCPTTRLRPSLLESRLRVAVFGEFNRGKSTLLNALLGRIVPPAKLVPTTGHTIRLVEGADEEVRVWFRGGGSAAIPGGSRRGLRLLGSTDGLGRTSRLSRWLPLPTCCAADWCCSIHPAAMRWRVRQPAKGCHRGRSDPLRDRCPETPQRCGTAFGPLARREAGQTRRRGCQLHDLLDEPDQQQARRRLDQWCRTCVPEELGRPWFEVNVLGALKYTLGSAPPPVDHFWGLRHASMRLRGRRRRQLQSRSRGCWLVVVLKALRQVHAQAARSLRQQAQRRKREQEDLCQRLRTSPPASENGCPNPSPASARLCRAHLVQTVWKLSSVDSRGNLGPSWSRPPDPGTRMLYCKRSLLERQANDTLTALAAGDKCPLEKSSLDIRLTPASRSHRCPPFTRCVRRLPR